MGTPTFDRQGAIALALTRAQEALESAETLLRAGRDSEQPMVARFGTLTQSWLQFAREVERLVPAAPFDLVADLTPAGPEGRVPVTAYVIPSTVTRFEASAVRLGMSASALYAEAIECYEPEPEEEYS